MYLLQLVMAAKYEGEGRGGEEDTGKEQDGGDTGSPPSSSSSSSSLGTFLVTRAGTNFSLANHLFWYLKVVTTDGQHGRVYDDLFEKLKVRGREEGDGGGGERGREREGEGVLVSGDVCWAGHTVANGFFGCGRLFFLFLRDDEMTR